MIYAKTVKTCGISAETVQSMLEDLMQAQTGVTMELSVLTGEVHIALTTEAADEESARALWKPVMKELKKRFGDSIYSTKPEETLEEAVVKLLKKRNLTVTFAESCTGGLLSGRLVNAAGASAVLKVSYVTYANRAKRHILGVKKTSLKKYTAVSEQVAREMALGAARAAKADAAVSVTGIAGPDGGTEEIPVGTVYIGTVVCGSAAVRKYHFTGSRTQVREAAAAAALTQLREGILKGMPLVR